jgi:hypothetical protein
MYCISLYVIVDFQYVYIVSGVEHMVETGAGCHIRSSCPCALTKHHAMKAYWWSGCITPLIL